MQPSLCWRGFTSTDKSHRTTDVCFFQLSQSMLTPCLGLHCKKQMFDLVCLGYFESERIPVRATIVESGQRQSSHRTKTPRKPKRQVAVPYRPPLLRRDRIGHSTLGSPGPASSAQHFEQRYTALLRRLIFPHKHERKRSAHVRPYVYFHLHSRDQKKKHFRSIAGIGTTPVRARHAAPRCGSNARPHIQHTSSTI